MAIYYPAIGDVRRLVGRGRTVPIFRCLLSDHLTPVSAFRLISQGAEHAFLLESVVGGEQIARYSFVGAAPTVVFRAHGDQAFVERAAGPAQTLHHVTDPLGELHRVMQEFRSVPHDELHGKLMALPRFTGGAVGYAAYDTVRYYERLPNPPVDDRRLDDLAFGIYDELVIFDHVNKSTLVFSHVHLDEGDLDVAYAAACRRIDRLVDLLNRPVASAAQDFDLHAAPEAGFLSTFTQPRFEEAVRRAVEYILAGDIFQVVLSQRLRVDVAADPFDIYRALRVVNPSPFMFYLRNPRCTLIGASPEILCRVEDGVVTRRPLAGTRPRGATADEDARLERELLADVKDRAEHIMLVDLGRNDVGRVAEPGSIRLSDVMSVERYSHVMHISSTVTGKVAAGRTAMDALRTTLPVGTVSGAPKIRAMEIIDELEPVRRGPYGGAVGYFDFSGNMDTCIGLRTMVITASSTPGCRTVDVQARAGIVADSVPVREYQETLNKARALLTAIAIARLP